MTKAKQRAYFKDVEYEEPPEPKDSELVFPLITAWGLRKRELYSLIILNGMLATSRIVAGGQIKEAIQMADQLIVELGTIDHG